jgi:cardiolipin synthase
MRSFAAGVIALSLFFCAAGCNQQRPVYYQIKSQFTVADPQFAQTMGNLLGPSLISGNTFKTLINGDQIFPAMLDAIRSAQKSIDVETYVYWSGTIGKEFAEAFCERAKAGVKVHVLLDWFGSDLIDPNYLKHMKECGVEVHEYHAFHPLDPSSWGQLDHRTHRKILVVDGHIGFTGGVGIADEWRGNADAPNHWRDTHYRIEGPVVSQLQAVFMDNWMQTTGVVMQGKDYFPAQPTDGKAFAQIFKSSSLGGSENMQLMTLLSLAAAGQNIRLESAYFVPDKLTVAALIDARKRDVRVEIIIPGTKIDEHFVREASRARWGYLLKAGVEIYEYQPTMFHCKQMIIDNRWVSIGSANLDNRSFRLNDEANLNVLDEDFAADQIHLFEEDKHRSHRVTYEEWDHRPLGEKIGDHLSSLLSWEL